MTLQTKLEQRTSVPVYLVEADFLFLDHSSSPPTKGIETKKYARHSAVNVGNDTYEPRVLSLGNFRRGATDIGNTVERSRVSVVLDDSDLALTQLVDNGRQLNGSEVKIKIGESSEPFSNFETFYTGKVIGSELSRGRLVLSITNIFNLLPDLTRKFEAKPGRGRSNTIHAGSVTAGDEWVDRRFNEGIEGRDVSWVFGAVATGQKLFETDSTVDAGTSTVTAQKLNVGAVKGFGAFYGSDAPVVNTIHCGILRACKLSRVYQQRNDGTAGQHTVDRDDITNGFTGSSPFTQTVTKNSYDFDGTPSAGSSTVSFSGLDLVAAEQDDLPSFLAVYSGDDYYSFDTEEDETQTWPSNGDPVTSYVYDLLRGVVEDLCGLDFADVFEDSSNEWVDFKNACEQHNMKAAGVVTGRRSPAGLIQEICDEFGISVSLSKNDKMVFYLNDLQESTTETLSPATVYTDALDVVRQSLSYRVKNDSLINELDIRFNFCEPENIWLNDDANDNQRITEKSDDSQTLHGVKSMPFDFHWAQTESMARSLAVRFLQRFKFGNPVILFDATMKAFKHKSFDVASVSHYRLPSKGVTYGDASVVTVQSIVFASDRQAFEVEARYVNEKAYIVGSLSTSINDPSGVIKIRGIDLADIQNSGVGKVVLHGSGSLLVDTVFVGDSVRLYDASQATQRDNHVQTVITNVTDLGAGDVEVDTTYTGWVAETSLNFEIARGWDTMTASQKKVYAAFCQSNGKFTNGDVSQKFFY